MARSSKDTKRVPGIRASGVALELTQNRPSLWVSDWREPEADPVLPDANTSRGDRLNTGSRSPIEKQN